MVAEGLHVKILVIEDNAAVREVIALMLVSSGHAVVTARCGRDALARLEAGETVDLVLTDLAMPEMSGWEVVQTVRSRWPTVRIGLITGAPLSLQEQREPVDVLITKPATLEQLGGVIARCDGPAPPAHVQARPRMIVLAGEPRRSDRWILLVRKGQDDVYEHLRRTFQTDTQVEVVMDRRQDSGRNPAWISDRLQTQEVAVIRKGS
jgi:CheY-like chemotaxis protein